VRLKTVPLKQFEVGREFNRRLKRAFDRERIEIPFPHVSIYAGEATRAIPVELVQTKRANPVDDRKSVG